MKRSPLALAPALAFALLGCRSPTQISVAVSTDLGCTSFKGATLTVGKLGDLEVKPATTVAGACPDLAGHVGTVVITPSGDKSDEIAIKVVAGVSIPASECKAPAYAGCIVARRALRFLPHEPLAVPIRLSVACQNNPCDERSTCVEGHGCVSAVIEDPSRCTGGGCDETTLTEKPAGDAGVDGADGDAIVPTTGHVKQLSAGGGHACAVLDDGKVRCWGDDGSGQLGSGRDQYDGVTERWTATPVVDLADATSVSARAAQSCAVRTNKTVVCWGANDRGALGVAPGGETFARPVAVPGVVDVEEVSVGLDHTCARHGDGRVSCWGWGSWGALANGIDDKAVHPPAYVEGLAGVTRIFPAHDVTCVRLATGKVSCWGGGRTAPLELPETGVVDVSGGEFAHLHVLLGAGLVKDYVLTATAFEPRGALVSFSKPAKQLASFYSPAALLEDDSVESTIGGAPKTIAGLGPGTTASLAGGATFLYNRDFDCALLKTGRVRCFGYNFEGGLGNDRPEVHRLAVKVAGVSGATRIGRYTQDLLDSSAWALMSDGTLTAWGSSPLHAAPALTPKPVTWLGSDNLGFAYTDVSGLVLKKPGTLTRTDRSQFVLGAPTGLAATSYTDFREVHLGAMVEVGRREAGGLQMAARHTGANDLGLFATGDTSAVPIGEVREIVLPSPAKQLRVRFTEFGGSEWLAVVAADGGIYCWGDNPEICGVTTDPVTTPARFPFVDATTKITDLCLGRAHACALRDDGTVWCWGEAASGQLGTTRTSSRFESKVPGIANAKGVACWGNTSCAWLGDGGALCWGDNSAGWLGDGTLVNRANAAPVKTAAGPLTDVVQISNACARHGDGSVSCWGDSYTGAVGDGSSGYYAGSVDVQGLDP